MTEDTSALTIVQGMSIEELSNKVDFPLDSTSIDWVDMREIILPQGTMMKAADLCDQHLTIFRAHRFESQFAEQQYAYWVVARNDETGELLNTVLGGAAIVEALDTWLKVQASYGLAKLQEDEAAITALEQVGAGRALGFTMGRKPGSKGNPYYFIKDEV